MKYRLGELPFLQAADLVNVRRTTRDLARAAHLPELDCTRVATAVSELGRIVLERGGTGTVCIELNDSQIEFERGSLEVSIVGTGGDFSLLEGPLDEDQRSLVSSSRALVPSLSVVASATDVAFAASLPLGPGFAVNDAAVEQIKASLERAGSRTPFDELQQQNRELLEALALLRDRQDELMHVNGELEDTNRGVLALYAELDNRAEGLWEANELKSRFLSYMSHEFRTPLSSIIALARLLLARVDGELSDEQAKQVRMISDAASDLSTTVNDLLDISKIEAGGADVRIEPVTVADLFSALRGMFRPIVAGTRVAVRFAQDEAELTLYTDEAKLAQILRNFISNAVKFTPSGEVRVAAERAEGDSVRFTVRDQGIGIPPAHLEKIFDEFAQLDSPIQRRVTGTGLGLPLCRKLATVLGGAVGVESTPRDGSTFYLVLPVGRLPEGSTW